MSLWISHWNFYSVSSTHYSQCGFYPDNHDFHFNAVFPTTYWHHWTALFLMERINVFLYYMEIIRQVFSDVFFCFYTTYILDKNEILEYYTLNLHFSSYTWSWGFFPLLLLFGSGSLLLVVCSLKVHFDNIEKVNLDNMEKAFGYMKSHNFDIYIKLNSK